MAYPTVSGPYGLIPINLIGGQVFAGATRQIPIGSSNDTAIFFGDVVKLDSAGLLQKDTGTSAATPVGVFLGCSYTDPTFGKVFRQYYPADTAASDIMAYVQDDPDALFKVAITTAGSQTVSGVTRTAVGNNSALIQGTGSTTTGNSAVSISATTATTLSLPVRIIDVVPETANAAGSYTEVIVKWNAPYYDETTTTVVGGHQYLNPVGV
jgi:hypothetical protein